MDENSILKKLFYRENITVALEFLHKLAVLAMKAALEGQKAVFLHNVGTLIVQSLHVASIKIKFKLSSSQEPSKCLFSECVIYFQ